MCLVGGIIGQDQAPAQLAPETVNGCRVNYRAQACKPCSTPCAKDERPPANSVDRVTKTRLLCMALLVHDYGIRLLSTMDAFNCVIKP